MTEAPRASITRDAAEIDAPEESVESRCGAMGDPQGALAFSRRNLGLFSPLSGGLRELRPLSGGHLACIDRPDLYVCVCVYACVCVIASVYFPSR